MHCVAYEEDASRFEPCLPTPGTKVPDSKNWIHEIKHDGYRLIVQRDGKRVRLLRRLVEGVELDGHSSRIWIEGLPGTDAGATMLLDELARP